MRLRLSCCNPHRRTVLPHQRSKNWTKNFGLTKPVQTTSVARVFDPERTFEPSVFGSWMLFELSSVSRPSHSCCSRCLPAWPSVELAGNKSQKWQQGTALPYFHERKKRTPIYPLGTETCWDFWLGLGSDFEGLKIWTRVTLSTWSDFPKLPGPLSAPEYLQRIPATQSWRAWEKGQIIPVHGHFMCCFKLNIHSFRSHWRRLANFGQLFSHSSCSNCWGQDPFLFGSPTLMKITSEFTSSPGVHSCQRARASSSSTIYAPKPTSPS